MYKNDILMDENQIIAYLNGQLLPEEERAFEAQMQADSALEKEVRIQESIIKALRHKEYNHFLSKVKDFEQTLPRIAEKEVSVPLITPKPIRKPGTIRRLVPWMAAAASVALLLIVGSYFLQPADNEKFRTYYTTPVFVKMASGEDDIANFNRGINFLNNDSVAQAITALQLIQSDSELFLGSRYILAHCYFRLSNYKVALKYIKEIEGKVTQLKLLFGDYKEVDQKEVEWFKSLCLLGDKQNRAARQIIDKIATDNTHPYHGEALKLRAQL